MTHIFISPHLDDIALSCGGYAHRLTASGERVIVATLITADAPPLEAQSETAKRVGAAWKLGPNPFEGRRKEDLAACATLGAETMHFGLPDAIYRVDDKGRHLYLNHFIGTKLDAYDLRRFLPQLEMVVREALEKANAPQATVYSPLAIAGHVDHQLVRRAVEHVVPSARLRFYEDYPYAGWDATRLNPDFAISAQTVGLKAERLELSEAELDARIRAIACYASQLASLFGEAANMPSRVREYVANVGGERYWRRK